MEHRQTLAFHVGSTPKQLELLVGDLSAIPAHDPFDVLVVSALSHDYTPTPTSVIGALLRHDVDVAALARDPEYDLRQFWHTWLSRPVAPGHGFTRILCFEQPPGRDPGSLVSSIFRALAPYIGPLGGVWTVAMPLIGTGDGGAAIEDVLPAQLAAVYQALAGTSLKRIAIVVRDEAGARTATPIFEAFKHEFQGHAAPGERLEPVHDVFLSYSHHNAADADVVVDALRAAQPDVRIFRDVDALRAGRDYHTQLDEALRRTRRVVALYTPEYMTSPACQDEFNTAWHLHEHGHDGILAPLYVRSHPLTSGGTALPDTLDEDRRRTKLHWLDCREGREDRIAEACARLLRELRELRG